MLRRMSRHKFKSHLRITILNLRIRIKLSKCSPNLLGRNFGDILTVV